MPTASRTARAALPPFFCTSALRVFFICNCMPALRLLLVTVSLFRGSDTLSNPDPGRAGLLLMSLD
jgi:hypothetical protein